MTTADITIGWTRSNLPDYSSFADGYRPGASQHEETIAVDVPDEWLTPDNLWRVAELVFDATNNPSPTGRSLDVLTAIYARGYHGHGAHFSLSVGDTVTVGEIRLACGSFGWDRVAA